MCLVFVSPPPKWTWGLGRWSGEHRVKSNPNPNPTQTPETYYTRSELRELSPFYRFPDRTSRYKTWRYSSSRGTGLRFFIWRQRGQVLPLHQEEEEEEEEEVFLDIFSIKLVLPLVVVVLLVVVVV